MIVDLGAGGGAQLALPFPAADFGRWRLAIWPVTCRWHFQGLTMAEDDPQRPHYTREDPRAWGWRLEVALPGTPPIEVGGVDGDSLFGDGGAWKAACRLRRELRGQAIAWATFEAVVRALAARWARSEYIPDVWGGHLVDPGPAPADAWSPWRDLVVHAQQSRGRAA